MILIGLGFSLHRGGIQRAGAHDSATFSRATVGGLYHRKSKISYKNEITY
jgi:hypothetical protein